MEWNELVLKRRSVRKYKSTPVTDDQILRVLETARIAPSAMHKQPWHFIVIKDEKTKKELAGRQGFAAQAPVIIVAVGNAEESPNWWQNDVGIAFEHIILAAADQGLGTCWMGSMARDAEIKSILGIPDKMRVVAITPIGVPDEVSAPKQRKSIDEIISWGSYGKKK